MHIHFIEDKNGDTIDANFYCSSYCHELKEEDNYKGWNGCHEIDHDTPCNNCNKTIKGIEQ